MGVQHIVSLRKTIEIQAPPARVFEILQRVDRAPRWQPGLRRAETPEPAPLPEGGGFHAESEAFGGLYRWHARATRVEPPREVRWRRDAGDLEHYDERYELQAVPGGTLVSFSLDLDLPFRLPTFVTMDEARDALSRRYDQALLNLKDLVEARSSGARRFDDGAR